MHSPLAVLMLAAGLIGTAAASPAVPDSGTARAETLSVCNERLDAARAEAKKTGRKLGEDAFEAYRTCAAASVRQSRFEQVKLEERIAAEVSLSKAALSAAQAKEKRQACHFYGTGMRISRICLTPTY